MNPAKPALMLEIIWFDDDLLELRLRASNVEFAGQANFYAALDGPRDFANHLEGFPRTIGDVREYEFGSTNLPGYGGARVRFSCKNGGHVAVQVAIHMNPMSEKDAAESANIRLATVPAAIDSFVSDLRHMQVQVGARAVLYHAT